MFFEVQIQREGGRRRAEPYVLFGHLKTAVRTLGTARTAVFLELVPPPNSPRGISRLANPVLIDADDSGMCFSGLEAAADGAWVAQTWKCLYSDGDTASGAANSARATRYSVPRLEGSGRQA